MYCMATKALPRTETLRTDEIANIIVPLPKRREKITCYLRQHWLLLGYSESIYKITISHACITGFQIYSFPLVSSVDMPVRWPSSHLTSLPLLPLDYAKSQCDYFCFLKSLYLTRRPHSSQKVALSGRCIMPEVWKGHSLAFSSQLLCPLRVCEQNILRLPSSLLSRTLPKEGQ